MTTRFDSLTRGFLFFTSGEFLSFEGSIDKVVPVKSMSLKYQIATFDSSFLFKLKRISGAILSLVT